MHLCCVWSAKNGQEEEEAAKMMLGKRQHWRPFKSLVRWPPPPSEVVSGAESRLDECEPWQLAVVNRIPNVKTFTPTFFSNRHLCHKEARVAIAKCSPVPHHYHHPPTSSLSLTYWWQSAQSLAHVHTIIWNLGDSKHSPYNRRPTTVCQPGKTNYHHLHSGLHTFTLHCSKKLLTLNVLLLLLLGLLKSASAWKNFYVVRKHFLEIQKGRRRSLCWAIVIK